MGLIEGQELIPAHPPPGIMPEGGEPLFLGRAASEETKIPRLRGYETAL
jgi:hypothetical protein